MADHPSAQIIVFSHANSFPASTYRTLFQTWEAAGYTVLAIDRFGHDPRYPVTDGWPHLVAQLHDFITRHSTQPVYLVGHSLGGYLSLMLAQRHPDLSRGVIVLDSPILQGWRRAALGLAKRTPWIDRVMPSRVSAQRTHEWISQDAVQSHFSSKPKFAAFAPEVLNDYLHHGTEDHPVQPLGRRLRFDRTIETAIYNTLPVDLLRAYQRRPPGCPLAFVAGTRSRELRRVGLSGVQQVFGTSISWIEGSHLYPFEAPDLTATEVLRWLSRFRTDLVSH